MTLRYADVVVPLPLNAMTFAIGENHIGRLNVGSRVVVQVGARKFYTGIIWRLHNNAPKVSKVKSIEQVVSEVPFLTDEQIALFEWIADYYMAPLGLVVKAALPSLLSGDGYSLEEIDYCRPKSIKTTKVSLEQSINEQQLHRILDELTRAKKQHQAVLNYASLCEGGIDFDSPQLVDSKALGVSSSIIKQLVSRGIFKTTTIEVPFVEQDDKLPSLEELPTLSEAQQTALTEISNGWKKTPITLLHGVTGSGKTEIYTHLIAQNLIDSKNVLLLVPEIALTEQLLGRLVLKFGNNVIPYHSRYSDTTRARTYMRLLDTELKGKLIVGVRSSVFLPLQNLGLIIIDEEHDPSYKQSDKTPSYNARETALMMASLNNSKVLLGSATPSLESYYNTLNGKYNYVKLDVRYSGVELPVVTISDRQLAVRRGEQRDHLSLLMRTRIEETLERKEQIMLYQNRRGFSPYVQCTSCAYVPTCPRCSVSLSYHRTDESLRCHYCGHTIKYPQECPDCKKPTLQTQGFGTEKIEEILSYLYPQARIARMDGDSTRGIGNIRQTIEDFKNKKIDILIGTQMITKGFDFGGVALIGILNADNMLNYPDFRAAERAFQTIVQVSGRAGRRKNQGQVIIQTSNPNDQTIREAQSNNFEAMASRQLAERQALLYPPYSRIIKITLSSRDYKSLWSVADKYAERLRPIFGKRVLGPEPPSIERLRGLFNAVIIIKIERSRSFSKARKLLAEITRQNAQLLKKTSVHFEVDPL